MDEWLNELQSSFSGNWWFLIWFAVAFVILFIARKEWRKSILIPCVLIAVIILNPWFYRLWNEVIGRSYWRTLWILPIIIVIAAVPAVLADSGSDEIESADAIDKIDKSSRDDRVRKIGRISRDSIPVFALLLFVAVLMFSGFPVYSYSSTTFTAMVNVDKLPDNVLKVADVLLELEDEPRVVTDYSLSVYLRQYSGKIRSLYGRNIDVEVTDPVLARQVFDNLTNGDLGIVHEKMVENDYHWLVTNNEDPDRIQKILDAGFVPVHQVNSYGIYETSFAAMRD